MADPDETNLNSSPNPEEENDEEEEEEEVELDEPTSSDSDSDSESETGLLPYTRAGGEPDTDDEENNTPEANVKRFMRVLNSKRRKRELEEEAEEYTYHEDLFDFPYDPENWREEDLKELWGDAPIEMTKPGWDPNWVDEEEEDIISEETRAGRDPPIAPFYVPYRKPFPVVPDNNYDISNPKSVIEELDRIEEFLKWVSYIFADGSSYEGTVWDDLAHGKGVYVAEQGLVRYEGEWLQNNMEGHGVVEVEIPHIEPVPGSKLEAKMRAEGKIIKRDFMSPEDREWLEKDIEDTMELTSGEYEIPFYENGEWVRQFGKKPEKGRYRYAGQWKHGRMHGCGLYEVNERTIYGRFYFGELVRDTYGCDAEISAMHAGIAEVAAAKARMFVNKPDGMVREERGPYSDPQHPYLYEEDDVWMAPGFINQFYEVPDYWKAYVHDVDEEREMWLNSFYKAPLRLPMPAELEYWWSKDQKPEFILLNKEPEPDPEDPSKLVYTEDPVILHTPTGRIINYVEDEEHGVRLFWQPLVKEGEDVDPDKVEFLPLGFDEFYGRGGAVQSDNMWKRFVTSMENACKPMFEKLEKWAEEKKKAGEMKIELLKKEFELAEAELSLKEAMEDMDDELKRMQEEEEKKVEMGIQEEDDIVPSEPTDNVEKTWAEKKEDEEEEEEEDDEEEVTASSFGSVDNQSAAKSDKKDSKTGKAPFGASSLSFAACSLVSTVPSNLLHTFTAWREGKLRPKPSPLFTPSSIHEFPKEQETPGSISFPYAVSKNGRLRAVRQAQWPEKYISKSCIRSHSKQKASSQIQRYQEDQCFNILSLHTPLPL
ncbi:protein TIC 100 [Nicotiana tabacum]|uniref:Protein TIC 100 n=1 Tax=Nicotiana tabacum TaxID=4097 RepID=A0A1S3XDN8_TOBAC|nr:PREDICTED: protein TIC 100 [Nicotiana tabacum]